jgi:CRP-like cAMP-binding protein
MHELGDLLKAHNFFQDFPEEYVNLLSGCAQNVHFKKGAYVFRDGQDATHFFVVRTGKVALEIYTPQRGPLVLDTVDPGEILGVSWLLAPPYRYMFDARVVEEISAIQIDAVCMRKKCDEDPKFGYQLIRRFGRVLNERLLAARLRLVDLYSAGGAGPVPKQGL